jgi:glucose-1-phosphate thymidylyltransferase
VLNSDRAARAPSDFVAVLPAGGVGSRLAPFRYPKELLPIAYQESGSASNGLRPRVIAEFAIEAFVQAGVRRCLVIIAPWKTDVMHYLGDGAAFGMEIAYVYQEIARGLPYALDLAYPWVAGHHVLFAMPDTLVQPSTCLATLRTFYRQTGADVALGVFPSAEAGRLGPVVLDGEEVAAIYDKPADPPVQQVWGVAVWGPAFSELLHCELRGQQRHRAAPGQEADRAEPVLGQFFELARRSGLKVKGKLFPEGRYADIGTPEGLKACMELWRGERNAP